MSRRSFIRAVAAALSLALMLALAQPATASRPIRPAAPELPGDSIWINAKPLTLARLHRRRVVLIAFLNSTNINSVRSLKTLAAWDHAWSLKGLMIIGVHTPTFPFQRDPAAVKAALDSMGVEFPVIIDNRRAVWKAYANDGWPAFFLIDGDGRIVYDHLGEDRYADLEAEIRVALRELTGDTPSEPPMSVNLKVTDCGPSTPEVSLVASSMTATDIEALDTRAQLVVLSAGEGKVLRQGHWVQGTNGLSLTEPNPGLSSYVRVIYRGTQAFAALSPGPRRRARIFVRQDELWMHPGNAGTDIQFDDEGRSFLIADRARLYAVAENPSAEDSHALEILPTPVGAGVHGFSFSNRCARLEAR